MYRKYVNGEITALQSYIIIISIMIGTGILGLSRIVAEVAQQDAWISVLVNGVFISIIMAAIIYTVKKYPKDNFLQVTTYLLTKPVAYLVTIAYIIYAVLATATIIRFLLEMVQTWLLETTPIPIISLIIVITTVYMVKNGLTVVARFNEVLFFYLIIFFLLIAVGLPEAQLINLRPVGGSGIRNIIKGAIPSFYAFGGYEVILVYYSYISDKHKPVLKYSVLSILVVTVFYTLTVMSQLALFGADELQRVLYPSMNYLRAVDFPVLERMELFFTVFWSFTVLGTIGLQYFAACILSQTVFKSKKTATFAYIYAPIIFVLSLYPRNTPHLVELSGYISYMNIFFGLALPLLLFIMSLIRGGKKSNEKSM